MLISLFPKKMRERRRKTERVGKKGKKKGGGENKNEVDVYLKVAPSFFVLSLRS